MLFRELIALYCDNHTGHKNTLCWQNAKFQYGKGGGTYVNHWVLKG
jgi:hypothetical protein